MLVKTISTQDQGTAIMMNFETVFHAQSGYPLSALLERDGEYCYTHAVDVYDGILFYTITPMSDDGIEALMRNETPIRDIIELATYTVEFNTVTGQVRWLPVTEETQINLPEPDIYLYAK